MGGVGGAPGRRALATALLEEFAAATGVDSHRPPRRYLWTDAFAVCGLLGLHERSGDERWLRLALRLVDQVHQVLGRHRPDDARRGWISGLSEGEGAERPTAGGLRIGKSEPERPAGEAYNPEREWNREGQYYHYLTRWMHALLRVWRVTGDPRHHRWAVELAAAAHRGFVANGRMHWKVSTDLSRPLVPSMGQHDPLDGRIAIEALRATAPQDVDPDALLATEAAALDHLCRGASWITHDALGVGGLLVDGLRVLQLRELGRPLDPALERQVFGDAARGLRLFAYTHRPEAPADHRLAFRELGLAIGIHAAERASVHLRPEATAPTAPDHLDGEWRQAVRQHGGLAAEIQAFWARPESRRAATWTEHEDISAVMLATALVPDGYLEL
jgi:hypothetical protein